MMVFPVEIEGFQYDEDSKTYFYPCPCGNNFSITKEDMENGQDVATCSGCSLIIKVIYDRSISVWRNSLRSFNQQITS
uniref:Diphthamide biosynthesis protein 3 n=1 Tax=Urocitellus parryii TaxID=9999 RepID=A0A8D2KHN2_UROPR